jgi:hypothetical protein
MTKKVKTFLEELKQECKTDYNKVMNLFEKHKIAVLCYESMKDAITKVKHKNKK